MNDIETDPQKQQGKPLRPRRRLRRIALTLASVVALLVVAAYLGRYIWIEPILKRHLIGLAKERLGADLVVDRILGDYWNGATLTDVSLAGIPGQSHTCRQITISWSPWLLLQDKDAFMAELEIELDGYVGAIDASVKTDTMTGELPGRLPSISLRNARLDINDADWRVQLQQFNASLQPNEEAIHQLRMTAVVEGHYRDYRLAATPIRTSLAQRGDAITGKFTLGDEARSLVSSSLWFGREEATGKQAFKLEGQLTDSPMRVAGTIDAQAIRLTAAIDALAVERMMPYLPPSDLQLTGTIATKLTATIDRSNPARNSASLEARGSTLRIGEWAFDSGSLQAGFQNGVVLVSRAEVTAGADVASLEKITVDTAGKFAGRNGETKFAASLTSGGPLAPAIARAFPKLPMLTSLQALHATGAIDANGLIQLKGQASTSSAELQNVDLLLTPCDGDLAWPPCAMSGSLRLQVTDLPKLAETLAYDGPALAGTLAVELGFSCPWGSWEHCRLAVNGAWQDGRVGDYRFSQAAIDGTLNRGQLFLDRLLLEQPNSQLTISDATTPLAPWLEADFGAALQQTVAAANLTTRGLDPKLLDAISEQLAPCLRAAVNEAEATALLTLNAGSFSGEATVVHADATLRVDTFSGSLNAASGLPDEIAFSASVADARQLQNLLADCYEVALPAQVTGELSARGSATLPTAQRQLAACPINARLTLHPADATTAPVDGTIDVSGTLARPLATAALNLRNLTVHGQRIHNGTLRLTADGPNLEVLALEVAGEGVTASGSGKLNLKSKEVQFKLAATTPNFGIWLPEASGKPIGRVAVTGELSGKWPSPTLIATASATDLSWHERRLPDLTANLQTRLPGPDDKKPAHIEITSLRVGSGDAAMSSSEPATLTLGTGNAAKLTTLQLVGSGSRLRLQGSVDDQDQVEGKLELDLSDAVFSGILPGKAGWQSLQLDLFVSGQRTAPELRLSGKVRQAKLASGTEVSSIAFDLTRSAKGIQLDNVDLVADHLQLKAVGMVPWDPLTRTTVGNHVEATIEVKTTNLAILDEWVPPHWRSRGEIHAALKLSGPLATAAGNLQVTATGIHFPEHDVGKVLRPTDLSAKLRLIDGKRVSIEQISLRAPQQFRVALAGDWEQFGSLAELSRARLREQPGTVDLRLLIDGQLPMVVADIQRTGVTSPGNVDADVTIKGKLPQPEWRGNVQLRDASLRLDPSLPTIRNVGLAAEFDGRILRLNSLRGELGAEPFTGSGQVTLANNKWLMDLQVSGRNLLIHRTDGAKLRADCDLRIGGSLGEPTLSGELTVVDGRYEHNLNILELLRQIASSQTATLSNQHLLFSIAEPPMRDARLDLKVRADPPIRIGTTMAKGAITPDLRLSGTGQAPVLLGDVAIEPSVISLVSGRLNIVRGRLVYTLERPNQPTVYLEGNARVLGYAINLVVDGPLDEPVVTLSSSPPLATEEILLLLLTGKPPVSGDAQATARNNRRMTLYVAQGLVKQWLGPDDTTGLGTLSDRLTVDLGHDVTRSGQDAIALQFHLTDSVLGTNNALVLTAERDIYDAYNAGIRLIIRSPGETDDDK